VLRLFDCPSVSCLLLALRGRAQGASL